MDHDFDGVFLEQQQFWERDTQVSQMISGWYQGDQNKPLFSISAGYDWDWARNSLRSVLR